MEEEDGLDPIDHPFTRVTVVVEQETVDITVTTTAFGIPTRRHPNVDDPSLPVVVVVVADPRHHPHRCLPNHYPEWHELDQLLGHHHNNDGILRYEEIWNPNWNIAKKMHLDDCGNGRIDRLHKVHLDPIAWPWYPLRPQQLLLQLQRQQYRRWWLDRPLPPPPP